MYRMRNCRFNNFFDRCYGREEIEVILDSFFKNKIVLKFEFRFIVWFNFDVIIFELIWIRYFCGFFYVF